MIKPARIMLKRMRPLNGFPRKKQSWSSSLSPARGLCHRCAAAVPQLHGESWQVGLLWMRDKSRRAVWVLSLAMSCNPTKRSD